MNAQNKFISRAKLADWLKELSSRFEVWAPRKEGEGARSVVVYRPFEAEKGLELDRKPTESAKHTMFPRSETLFNFRRNLVEGAPSLELEEAADPAPRLVFGLLSCDARGFQIFDPVYNGSGTNGQAKDTYYLKRRSSTVLIVKSCSKVLSTCFCNWVGGGPASTEGADVLATEVQDGFLLTPVSERGAAVLDSSLLAATNSDMESAAADSQTKAAAALPAAPDLKESQSALLGKFDNAAFWQAESSKCLSCGACTYLCPTCYCFNISDEAAGYNGVRLRNWDSCMMPLFTMEASGHNPRTPKMGRLKNRVGHKFSYYPSLHGGRIACCGCGRCIKSCPSSVDIRRIVTDAIGFTETVGLKEQNNG
ncbi:MAG: 4Fe-4S dicluster domain-containing protein [Deltaproteobacteria bacterium]|jgi:ferredoxin|nr:4Fe-4S dicluster domain-containing protein [Deltaproteobacteria bacterium]